MPIQLDTPYSVGAADDNSPYQQAKIVQFTLDSAAKVIELITHLGNTVDSAWVPGISLPQKTVQRFRIVDADYDTLVAATSEGADEVYYERVASKLYEWLIANNHFAGTIV